MSDMREMRDAVAAVMAHVVTEHVVHVEKHGPRSSPSGTQRRAAVYETPRGQAAPVQAFNQDATNKL
jgi:hypothetical protein